MTSSKLTSNCITHLIDNENHAQTLSTSFMLHAEIKAKYKEVDFSNFQTKLRNFEDTKSSLLTIKISICYRIVIKWSLQLKITALQNLLLVFRAANDCLVSLAISLLIDRCIGFITKKYWNASIRGI